MGYRGRDVEISLIENGLCLVGACDSCGAVGSKELDLLKVPARLVGQLTARTALLEIIAVNARPGMMTVAISSEPHPTGDEILKGVRQALEEAGLPDLPLVISTEKNFITGQTGLGIGITGTCRETQLRIAGSGPGDGVYCLGRPLVGKEVTESPAPRMPTATNIRTLLNMHGVHDVVPVGSRGILAEARDLACYTRTTFMPAPSPEPNMNKSAGPSTCMIFTADATWKTDSPDLPELFRIGNLASPDAF